MSPERPEPGTALDWLRHARSDLALARLRVSEDVLLETLCFHAQQAAEKSLKAVLVHVCAPFPRTHHLKTLIELLPPAYRQAQILTEIVSLTDYAVLSRYPGAYEEINEEEYREALRLAEAIVAWATHTIVSLDTRI